MVMENRKCKWIIFLRVTAQNRPREYVDVQLSKLLHSGSVKLCCLLVKQVESVEAGKHVDEMTKELIRVEHYIDVDIEFGTVNSREKIDSFTNEIHIYYFMQ
ncbi:hypothetical protein RF11_13379 [Thelohanellus kitauei]|uniref:Uncharacterized protein n=1 Tax=Thelohanellus kitauei TaxID=669202 RepID=A0A0C2ITT7_THEKT|nr:hypothetical protein RF11_13379 [Thelohanellus kitauei]